MYESGDQAKKGTNQELEFLASMTSEERDLLLGRVQPFMKLMMQYRCAIREMETKLQVLNDEFSLQHERNPFESIKSRVKEPMSIIEKMRRRGWDLTVDNIEDKLNDVAGVRVICSFAVSYTHLDVYKRQLVYWQIILVWELRQMVRLCSWSGWPGLLTHWAGTG